MGICHSVVIGIACEGLCGCSGLGSHCAKGQKQYITLVVPEVVERSPACGMAPARTTLTFSFGQGLPWTAIASAQAHAMFAHERSPCPLITAKVVLKCWHHFFMVPAMESLCATEVPTLAVCTALQLTFDADALQKGPQDPAKAPTLKPQMRESALTVRNLRLPVRQWGGLQIIRRAPCARKSPQAARALESHDAAS